MHYSIVSERFLSRFEQKWKNIDFSKPVKNGPDINGFDRYYGHCGSLDMAPYVWGNAREMNRGAAQNVLDLMNRKRPEYVVNPEVFEAPNLRATVA